MLVEQTRLPLPAITTTARPATLARPRIVKLRAAGYSWQRIAARLNADGIRTPTGHGPWHGASVWQHADPARNAARMRQYRARLHDTGH